MSQPEQSTIISAKLHDLTIKVPDINKWINSYIQLNWEKSTLGIIKTYYTYSHLSNLQVAEGQSSLPGTLIPHLQHVIYGIEKMKHEGGATYFWCIQWDEHGEWIVYERSYSEHIPADWITVKLDKYKSSPLY